MSICWMVLTLVTSTVYYKIMQLLIRSMWANVGTEVNVAGYPILLLEGIVV